MYFLRLRNFPSSFLYTMQHITHVTYIIRANCLPMLSVRPGERRAVNESVGPIFIHSFFLLEKFQFFFCLKIFTFKSMINLNPRSQVKIHTFLANSNCFKVKSLHIQKEIVVVAVGENSIVFTNMFCLLFHSSEITLRCIDWGLENEIEIVRQLFKTRRH